VLKFAKIPFKETPRQLQVQERSEFTILSNMKRFGRGREDSANPFVQVRREVMAALRRGDTHPEQPSTVRVPICSAAADRQFPLKGGCHFYSRALLVFQKGRQFGWGLLFAKASRLLKWDNSLF
jgi:hypothetical protein